MIEDKSVCAPSVIVNCVLINKEASLRDSRGLSKTMIKEMEDLRSERTHNTYTFLVCVSVCGSEFDISNVCAETSMGTMIAVMHLNKP